MNENPIPRNPRPYEVKIKVGGKTPEPLTASPRPVYPDDAWDGTVIAEYAKLCGADNNVPRKLYIEAFRTILGAVVGDRLTTDIDGAFPRSYTVLIAPPGRGKGTAISRAEDFFAELASGDPNLKWKNTGIGARKATFSSVPGLVSLTREPVAVVVKGEEPRTWRLLPRIIGIHEEGKTLLSALMIKGGVGSATEGIVCQLWDRTEFFGSATGSRSAEYGNMLLSLLIGITPDDWENITSAGDIVGGGLMSRLNLIGTEHDYGNVDAMRKPDFTQLQRSFLPRIYQLQDSATHIPASNEAVSVIGDWFKADRVARANVRAWRAALLLSWLRHETVISERSARDAVRLAEYQRAMHACYMPTPTDNPWAAAQAKIVNALKKGSLTRRALYRAINGSRLGTGVFGQALDGLLREHIIGATETEYFVAE